MSWKKVKLGEICSIEKGAIGIQKAIPGEYPLVVTGEDRKSHNEFQFDCEAVIIPLVSGTGHGHASIKRIHFQTGKFALGNILCAVIPKDTKQLNTEYLFRFLDLNKENELVARMKGMANVTLPIKEIAQIEIPLPTIKEQSEFVKMYKDLETKSSFLTSELTHQLTLVKKLRQQLLQDAVQGKLVEQNATDEPASELLKKIKAERLNRVGFQPDPKKDIGLKPNKFSNHSLGLKPRAIKELPPIKPEEIPFEIPENWIWCRLGDLSVLSEAGSSFKCEEIPVSNDEWGVIKVSAVSWDVFLEDKNKVYSKTQPNDISAKINVGDFLISRANTSELVGKSVVVKSISKNLLLSDKTIRFTFSKLASTDYIHLCNNYSRYAREYYALMGTGSSPSMKNITREHMRNLLIPLPPLAEQNRIVQKLDELMQYCNELEASIKQSQQQNEKLLQQVLREALRGEGTETI